MVKIKVQKAKKRKRQPTLWLIVGALISGMFFYAYKNNYFQLKDTLNAQVLQWLGFEQNTENTNTIIKNPDFKPSEAFGLPAFSTKDIVIRHTYYTLAYSEEHEQAFWVAYKLTRRSIKGNAERENDFRPDPQVPTESATLQDYRGSGYDRGHLAPAADFKISQKAMSETFFMSNMSPQEKAFNTGIWRVLEEKVRDWVLEGDDLYVVTGPILKGKGFKTIGQNEVSVPKYYYKILLDFEEPEIKAIAFLMKNEESNQPLESFAVSINQIEELAGIDFFPNLPDDIEEKLESQLNTSLWF